MNTFRQIKYKCLDGVERKFSPLSMADMNKYFPPLLLALQDNDPWISFLLPDKSEESGDKIDINKFPLSQVEYSFLMEFMALTFTKQYCDIPLSKNEIPDAINSTDIRQILSIALGIASQLKEKPISQIKS